VDDAEHEQFQDDSDVEISDIPGKNAADSDVVASPKMPYWPFRRPASPRQRTLQLTVIISVVALILFIILGSSASVRDALVGGIFGRAPTPTQALAPGSDLFYIEGTPSWGRVSIDGRTLSQLPIIRITPPSATSDPPLQLARGRHQIVWHADPFRPQSCFVSVPELNTDTCRNVGVVQPKPGLSARIIILSESLATLAADQRTALIQETQATLNTLQSTEIVRPGEQFVHALPRSLVDTAVRPLRATLRFELDTDTTSNALCSGEAALCIFGGQDCRLFCSQLERTDPVPMPLLGPGWYVMAIVRSTWEYATLDGQVIADNQPDDRGNARDFEHFVSLNIRWNSTKWYISISDNSYGDLACASAQEGFELDSELQTVWKDNNQSVQWQFVAGPNRATGCLVIATIMQDSNTTPSSTPPPVAYLLHRFGIFLAANDVAHHYWPLLSLANTYEQKLAQQLATLQLP
jgi:hypothetical protein